MAGRPIWYELMTPDPGAVAPFYRATLGWDIQAPGHRDAERHPTTAMIGRADGGFAGGVLTADARRCRMAAARPGWLPYFHVDDVDAAVAKAQGARRAACAHAADDDAASARWRCSAIRKARRST